MDKVRDFVLVVVGIAIAIATSFYIFKSCGDAASNAVAVHETVTPQLVQHLPDYQQQVKYTGSGAVQLANADDCPECEVSGLKYKTVKIPYECCTREDCTSTKKGNACVNGWCKTYTAKPKKHKNKEDKTVIVVPPKKKSDPPKKDQLWVYGKPDPNGEAFEAIITEPVSIGIEFIPQ